MRVSLPPNQTPPSRLGLRRQGEGDSDEVKGRLEASCPRRHFKPDVRSLPEAEHA